METNYCSDCKHYCWKNDMCDKRSYEVDPWEKHLCFEQKERTDTE